MLTKLERAHALRARALYDLNRSKDLLHEHGDDEISREFHQHNIEFSSLEVEMYGDLIAKYESMSEETI